MKINEITIEQIKAATNWKVVNPNELFELELVDLTIAECVDFADEEYVVYSSISVSDSGNVTPTIMIKEAGSLEYGGDYCAFREGRWRRIGDDPNPDSQDFGKDYVANQLANDPSFDTGDPAADERTYNRNEFNRWKDAL